MLELGTIWAERRKMAKERMEICDKCDYYRPLTTQCAKCSCFMNVKGMWPNAKCPINKWGPYEEKPNG
jgi:hypothetical protein